MFGRKNVPGALRLGLLVLALALLCTAASAFTIGGYEFGHGTEHTISNAGSELTYYTVPFTLSNATGDDAGDTFYTDGTTAADWSDIRFTNGDGSAVYPYWIESTTATTAYVWANITSVPNGDSDIHFYFDSETAPAASDGTATFPLFDDFNDGIINTGLWSTSGATGAVTEVGGMVNISTTATSASRLLSTGTFGAGTALRSLSLLSSAKTTASEQGYFTSGSAPWAKFFAASGGDKTYTAQSSTDQQSTPISDLQVVHEVIRNATASVIFVEAGSVVQTHTTVAGVPTGALNVYFSTAGNPNTVLADWMLVRPYSYPEPSHGSTAPIVVAPVAAFSANVTGGGTPLTVAFTDASTGPAAAWAWDFDNDGDTDSTDQHPTYTYTDVGTYTVNLTATNAAGSDSETKTDYITVSAPYDVPEADFFLDPTTMTAPYSVSSLVYSTGPPTAYAWDFDGDGSIDSTEMNATYEYTVPGIYTVTLNVSNPAGFDLVTKTDYITVSAPAVAPVAAFSANVTSGYAPLAVQFADLSTNTPDMWWWEFNVPTSTLHSEEQNPVCVYTEPGIYTSYLLASNVGGFDGEYKYDYITVLPPPAGPVASFTSDVIAGHAPLSVQFTDTSTGSPTAWAWDFDGDAVADSAEQNPTHDYAADGNYTVTLQVSSAGGTDLETKTDYIYVGALTAIQLKASFRYTPAAGNAPHTVQFTDTTEANGTYARSWTFGDGETSTEANPVHNYTSAGEYDVKLVVSSDYRTSTANYKKVIKAYPVAAITPLPTNTYGAKMTAIMDSDFNLSVIGETLPSVYTDLMPATVFWGLLFAGVFIILFIRQGTSWLVALLGILIGGNVLLFLPPEWQALGQAMLIVSIGAFLYVMIQGRIRSS